MFGAVGSGVRKAARWIQKNPEITRDLGKAAFGSKYDKYASRVETGAHLASGTSKGYQHVIDRIGDKYKGNDRYGAAVGRIGQMASERIGTRGYDSQHSAGRTQKFERMMGIDRRSDEAVSRAMRQIETPTAQRATLERASASHQVPNRTSRRPMKVGGRHGRPPRNLNPPPANPDATPAPKRASAESAFSGSGGAASAPTSNAQSDFTRKIDQTLSSHRRV